MCKKLWVAIFKIFVIVFLIQGTAFALSPSTHRAINLRVANSTMGAFSLNQYLINNLKFSQGIGETFNGQRVDLWLSDGGEYEDKPPWTLPYLRSKNHFHNPINEQGFSGIWDTGVLSGMSATQWALLPQNTQSPGGHYSWYDVRNYYLKALTLSTKTERDTNFANTFRGLGQLMHLVEDMSVPEHTRNDGHYIPFTGYEYWVERNPGSVTTAAASPSFFTGAIFNIASFIDTNQYNGTNPGITTSNTIGLSEYTNANFFSDDSIFTGFTYPSIVGASKWVDNTNNRQYLKKTTEGVPVEHLAASSWLYFYRWKYFPQYTEWLPLGLDSNVYSDYASLLLPRAVGYSAGLLNYFFRGKMDMVKVQNTSGQYIIKNDSDETMDGVFSLYYDDVNDNRYLVNSWNLSGSNAIPPHGQSNTVTFATPTSPQPKEKGKYTLVFQGNIGNEIGAVVGKVVSVLCDGAWVWVSTSCECGDCSIYIEDYGYCGWPYDVISGETKTKYYVIPSVVYPYQYCSVCNGQQIWPGSSWIKVYKWRCQ